MSKSVRFSKTFDIFVSFSSEDEKLQNEVGKRLKPLQRDGSIKVWDYQSIPAGTEVAIQIEEYISKAHVILLLVSANFLGSDQCHYELEKSIEQHNTKGTQIVPILLKPSDWKNSQTQLKEFKALPSNHVPVTRWEDEDEAFQGVLEGIREVLENLYREEYEKLEEQLKDKIHSCQRKLETNCDDASLLIKLVSTWKELGQLQEANSFDAISSYKEALAVCEKLIQVKPESYIALSEQGTVLEKLDKPEEAAISYEKGLEIKPNDQILLTKNSAVQEKLGKYDKAIALYDKILELDQDNYLVWTQRGTALRNLNRFKEAIESYNRALTISPNYRIAKYYQRWTYRLMLTCL